MSLQGEPSCLLPEGGDSCLGHLLFLCLPFIPTDRSLCPHCYFNARSIANWVPSALPEWDRHTYPTVTVLHGLTLPCSAAEAAGAGGGAGDVGPAILLQLYEGPAGKGKRGKPGSLATETSLSSSLPRPRAGQPRPDLRLPTVAPCALPASLCAPESFRGKRQSLSARLEAEQTFQAPNGRSQSFPPLASWLSYFSLLGQISGELGLDEVSDFIS